MFATASRSASLSVSQFGHDIAAGLARPQKSVPSSWLYDDIGSALFEVITLLPEYGLTRADSALLREAAEDIVRAAGEPSRIIELGSGSGTKTRHILEAAARYANVDYLPVDISGAALRACVAALQSLEGVRIAPIEAQYLDGIEQARQGRHARERGMVLFLGSTIGNFAPADAAVFLRGVRQKMSPGDTLLLGADLVKPREQLLSAYDDALGVTAAFNLNLLGRINRELDGEFDLGLFAHEARFDQRHSRVEMHLRSRVAQEVWIGALDMTVPFARGETIWTESSYKFRLDDLRVIGEKAGWTVLRQWQDSEWGFSETLFSA